MKVLLAATLALVTIPLLAESSRLPDEVHAFMRERKLCEHFLSEPVEGSTSEQRARQAFVSDSIDIYCAGTDKKLAALRRSYAKEVAVMDALKSYAEKLE